MDPGRFRTSVLNLLRFSPGDSRAPQYSRIGERTRRDSQEMEVKDFPDLRAHSSVASY